MLAKCCEMLGRKGLQKRNVYFFMIAGTVILGAVQMLLFKVKI